MAPEHPADEDRLADPYEMTDASFGYQVVLGAAVGIVVTFVVMTVGLITTTGIGSAVPAMAWPWAGPRRPPRRPAPLGSPRRSARPLPASRPPDRRPPPGGPIATSGPPALWTEKGPKASNATGPAGG